jgi:hypothetical protein
MKKFKASDLSSKRSEILAIAEAEGAYLQVCKTNGEVSKEFVIISKDEFMRIDDCMNGDEPRHYPTDF